MVFAATEISGKHRHLVNMREFRGHPHRLQDQQVCLLVQLFDKMCCSARYGHHASSQSADAATDDMNLENY